MTSIPSVFRDNKRATVCRICKSKIKDKTPSSKIRDLETFRHRRALEGPSSEDIVMDEKPRTDLLQHFQEPPSLPDVLLSPEEILERNLNLKRETQQRPPETPPKSPRLSSTPPDFLHGEGTDTLFSDIFSF